MPSLNDIAVRIIKEQELVIGPLAWSEARKVTGLTIVNQTRVEIAVVGNSKEVIDRLVAQYERLFGRASHEVCREATLSLVMKMSPSEVPASLR
ncbi:MAG: hypothetical protein AAB605_01135 [Patescibacteria group bacterium]